MTKNRVCPVERAGSLDNSWRRWFQNPQKILKPYLRQGMTVLDVGCGPGFFSLAMAEMVGESGRVIAVDLQQGMLDKLQAKLSGTQLEKRVQLHLSADDRLGVTEPVDFALLFYMVHEVPDKASFFAELYSVLKSESSALLVEPPLHVSDSAFQKTLQLAEEAGFSVLAGPKMILHKTALLLKK